MDYSICYADRYDNTIKTDNGETIKVISLLVEELAEIIDEMECEECAP
jgi:hypothetical protein